MPHRVFITDGLGGTVFTPVADVTGTSVTLSAETFAEASRPCAKFAAGPGDNCNELGENYASWETRVTESARACS